MSLWRRLRAVGGMGVLWAVGGAGIGGLFELVDNVAPGAFPFIGRVDMWPQTLAIPGFMGGVCFALLLLVAGRRLRFDDLTLPRFTAGGALTGALLGALLAWRGAPWYAVAILGAAGAVTTGTSLLLARRARPTALPEPPSTRQAVSRGADGDPLRDDAAAMSSAAASSPR